MPCRTAHGAIGMCLGKNVSQASASPRDTEATRSSSKAHVASRPSSGGTPHTRINGSHAPLEVPMSLPVGERRKLRAIERAQATADPALEARFSMFSQLSWHEEMPRTERLNVRAVRRRKRAERAIIAYLISEAGHAVKSSLSYLARLRIRAASRILAPEPRPGGLSPRRRSGPAATGQRPRSRFPARNSGTS
jgi:hypothetical protein